MLPLRAGADRWGRYGRAGEPCAVTPQGCAVFLYTAPPGGPGGVMPPAPLAPSTGCGRSGSPRSMYGRSISRPQAANPLAASTVPQQPPPGPVIVHRRQDGRFRDRAAPTCDAPTAGGMPQLCAQRLLASSHTCPVPPPPTAASGRTGVGLAGPCPASEAIDPGGGLTIESGRGFTTSVLPVFRGPGAAAGGTFR